MSVEPNVAGQGASGPLRGPGAAPPDAYLDLLPAQHRQKPHYAAFMRAILEPLCNLDDTLGELRRAFDLDTATGVRLDALGERVGISRRLLLPVENTWFSLDTVNLGTDEGYWQDRWNPEEGMVVLPDDMYRLILRAKIAANAWDGTVEDAYHIWNAVFAGTGVILFIEEDQRMGMNVGIAGIRAHHLLLQVLAQGCLGLKPEGVRLNYYIIPTDEGPMFSLDADTDALAGLDEGSWSEIVFPLKTF
jgi:hypothetical protein